MTLGPRPALALALPAIAGALLMLAQTASAQEAPKPELERAQKAADAVFHWIKLNADKGASRDKPAAAPAPAPAPAAVARKPAPAPAPVAAAPKPAPSAAPTPAATAAVAPPTAVAAAPQAAPEPELERAPVVLASAAPTPAPTTAPMAAAARAVEPPPKPAEEEAEEPLKLLAKVEPAIPRQLQQGNFRTGFAQVQFTVGTDGSVQQASVIKASHSRLGTAAVDAVKQWRFAPLRKAREAAVEVAFKGDTD